MSTKKQRVFDKALELLDAKPKGMRYTELVKAVLQNDGSLNENSVYTWISELPAKVPDKVHKPSRGLFRLTKYQANDGDEIEPGLVETAKAKEEDFYKPFADWLVNEMEECTKAIALGGRKFGDKWGTPDVIGKRESKRSDIIQAPVEIVSAEIKPDVYQLVTAFGQACAYCLFSHKVYLVVSCKAPEDEIARLDSLCQVFGLGLVLFDADDPKEPDFTIRSRPRYQQPDLFYANKYMKLIEAALFA